jgi:hypothetical protein
MGWKGQMRMSAGSLALAVVVGLLTIYSAVSAVRLWSHPDRADRILAAYAGLPFGPRVRRGTVRGAWPRTAILASVTGIALIGTAPTHADLVARKPNAVIAVILIALLLIAGLLQLSIILVNRPRFIVPRYMRAEPGVLFAGDDEPKGSGHVATRR